MSYGTFHVQDLHSQLVISNSVAGQLRTGNHDAGGRDRTRVEGVDAGGVDRVRDGKIVGVKDEELGVDGIAEALGNVVGLGCEI
jgi:hypothetical protein